MDSIDNCMKYAFIYCMYLLLQYSIFYKIFKRDANLKKKLSKDLCGVQSVLVHKNFFLFLNER